MRQPQTVLPPEESASLREQLLAALARLSSAEEATLWAQKSLPVKNTLTATDSRSVEQAFEARVTALEGLASPDDAFGRTTDVRKAARLSVGDKATLDGGRPGKLAGSEVIIDKSALALPEPRRVRDKVHIKFVSKQPCLVCGRQPADAHHLRFAQSRALGRKVSDELTIPLCRGHHREVHGRGDEAKWWKDIGIEPLAAAEKLWAQTRRDIQPTSACP
jgi:hypothetical protein